MNSQNWCAYTNTWLQRDIFMELWKQEHLPSMVIHVQGNTVTGGNHVLTQGFNENQSGLYGWKVKRIHALLYIFMHIKPDHIFTHSNIIIREYIYQ